MRAKILPVLFGVCFGLTMPAIAQEQSPIRQSIESSPEFVRAPDLSKLTIESNNNLPVYFSTDYERCKAHYGEKRYMACNRDRKLTGRKAKTGIAIRPEIEGEWKWVSNEQLAFTPKGYWKAGESYSVAVNFDVLGVPKQVVMYGSERTATAVLNTAPLKISISKMTFMQDPDKPDRKLVSARLDINYPIDPATLESRLRIEMEENTGSKLVAGSETFKPEIKFDEGNQGAWVTIPVHSLPDQERYMRLNIDAGVEPKHGGAPSQELTHERTRVPSHSTYLTLAEPAAIIARQPDKTPVQVVTFETNVKASPDDVLKHLKLYLLPAQHPVTKLNKNAGDLDRVYEWKAANELTPEILKLSEVVPLSPFVPGNKNATTHTFTFTAPSGRYLYLVADKELTAFGGYTLGRASETVLRAPEWPNDLHIMQPGSILTLSGSHKLSLHVRGADKLAVEVAQIRPEALQHFISQTSGNISNPEFTYNFGKEDIAKIDSRDMTMEYRSPQESQFAAFDFTPYLKDGQKGIFLVSFQGYKDKKAAGQAENRFVLVTDLGLLVKQNAYTGRDIFLMSFRSGQPVGDAAISVLGRNGMPVFTGKTGADGHVTLPDFTNSTRDREPVAIIAQNAGDYAFIPYDRYDRQVNTSRFDVGGTMMSDEGLKGFVFSDRGIYRPGDTVHLGLLVHNNNWTLPPDLPLRLVITDPRGRKIKDTVLKFSNPGAQDYSIDTLEAWPTGTYRASLYVALAENQTGTLLNTAPFRVEEFQPDLLKIKTQFVDQSSNPVLAEGWIHAPDIKAAVTLTNLYGTPASERRVTGTVTLNPGTLTFDKYKDFTFFDAFPAQARSAEYKLADVETDMEGKTTLPLDLEKQAPATYNMTLQTQGFEAGSGKGVTAYSTILVSPMIFAVGQQSTGNLSYLRKGDTASVKLIAIDPYLACIAVPGLTLELVRKDSISSLVKRNDGSYAYETVTNEELVKSESFAIAAADTTLMLPTTDLGNYIYRLKTSKSTVVQEIAFRVAGEGQRTGDENTEATLKILIDKPEYNLGEEMEISITAPYTGAGLITLESDHVLAYKWFTAAKTDTVQKIAIPKDFAGKGYVNVAFVRDVNSHEIYMTPASYGIVPFTANMARHTAKIALSVPDIVKPGEPVTVHYKGSAKGKAFIYAVDEGILQVAKYKTPDPLRFFLLNRALQVATMQMLDLLMPEYTLMKQLSSSGGDGDGDGAALGKHLNPFKRKTLAPAVYWSGLVDLDTADKSVTFTPPGHFNGEMRVMAIVVAETSIGRAEEKITVQGDLVLTPNAPLFLAPGDESNASVTVANNIKGSSKDAKLTLSTETTEGLVVSGLSAAISIPEGQEKTVNFTLKARDNPGPAILTLKATDGKITQTALATLSVRPPVAKETTLTSGYSDTGMAKIQLTRKIYPAFAEREITVSPLPTAYVLGLLRFIEGYPYGCTEQTLSKAFPQISLSGQAEFAVSEESIRAKVGSAIDTLRGRQTSDGGFTTWDDGGGSADPFITAYAAEFLTRAREASIPVPSDLIESALQYLREDVNRDPESLDDARRKAYAIYILTSNGMVTTNEILHLLKYFMDEKIAWQTDLTAIYLAASYQLMQQGEMAGKTLDDFDKGISADDLRYENWDSMEYNVFIKQARYISLLARYFPERLKALDPKIIFTIATFIQEQRYSTLSSVYAIQALIDYQKIVGTALAANPPILKADGASVAMETAGVLQKAPLPPEARSLELSGPKASLFYTVAETGFDRSIPGKPVTQNMTIERVYQTRDGKPLDGKIAIGEIVDAVIKINAHDNKTIENVAIVDLIPAGFELTLDQPTEGTSLQTSFTDRREDRIIAFGTVTPDETVFHYHMRATTKGRFIVPPPFAEAMYDLTTKARGSAGTMIIEDAKKP